MTGDDLSGVWSALEDLRRAQEALGASSSQMARTLDTVVEELHRFRERFEVVARDTELRQNVLTAHLQIVGIRQELEKRFGHYAEIRRLAQGTLQAMDAGTVIQESMQELSEHRMLTAPGYWLGAAVVGLAAWIRDDRIIAERAMENALSRADHKTSLFYALVLARHRRDVPAGKWLRRALASEEPRALPGEFTVVLDAAVGNVLGPATRPYALEHMTEWWENLSGDRGLVADQVGRWRALLAGMRSPLDAEDEEFDALPRLGPESWLELVDVHEEAAAFGLAHRRFRALDQALADEQERPRKKLKDQVDLILGNLVTKFDDDESQCHRQLTALWAIVDAAGDPEAAARASSAGSAAGGDTVDFLTMITDSAVNRDGRVSSETQRLSVALAKEWIGEAARDLEQANRERAPATVEITFGPWTGRMGRHVELKAVKEDAQAAIDVDTARRVKAVRLEPAGSAALVGGGAALVVGAITGVEHVLGLVAFLLVLLGLASGVYAFSCLQQLGPRRDAVRLAGARQRRQAPQEIEKVAEELERWRDRWERRLAEVDTLRAYLHELPDTDALLDAAGPGRTVVHPLRRGVPAPRSPDRDPGRPVFAERSEQRPSEDSSGRQVALRLPDWDLLPPPWTSVRPERLSG